MLRKQLTFWLFYTRKFIKDHVKKKVRLYKHRPNIVRSTRNKVSDNISVWHGFKMQKG